MSAFYNPWDKKVQWGSGINDFVAKLMQMMMMKQVLGQQGQQPQGAEASGQAQLGQPGQAPMVGSGVGSQPQPQPTMGAGPPGMAQAGMAQNMAQQMPMGQNKPLQISPELLQALMMMLQKPGGGGMGQMGQRGY